MAVGWVGELLNVLNTEGTHFIKLFEEGRLGLVPTDLKQRKRGLYKR